MSYEAAFKAGFRIEGFYICSECAAKRKGKWPKDHRGAAHEAECPYCHQTKMLTPISDWKWR